MIAEIMISQPEKEQDNDDGRDQPAQNKYNYPGDY